MSLVTAYYGIFEHRGGQYHVRYMTANVDQALDVYVTLGGRIKEGQKSWVRDTLQGKVRTTDNHPASPSYSSGTNGLFLSISREALTEDQSLAAIRHHRQSKAQLLSPEMTETPQTRRRSRP